VGDFFFSLIFFICKGGVKMSEMGNKMMRTVWLVLGLAALTWTVIIAIWWWQ